MNFLLLLTIFLIPLLGASGSFGYEQIKVLFFILSITLIGFLSLRKQIKWTRINYAAGLFILILLLASFTGIDIRNSFLGKEPYFQGLALYAYLFLFSLLISSAKIKLEHIAIALAGSAMAVSLVAIQSWITLNIFNIPVPTYAGRVVSTFGQPNFYSGFLLLTLPFSYYLFKQNKLFGTVSGLISVIGIFVSYSRSAILMALIFIILALIDQLKIKIKASLVVLGIIVISVFLALKFSSGIIGNEISRPLLTNNPDLTKESVEKRAYIWPVIWQLFLQRPILGYGLENINKSFADYFEANKHSLFEANSNISPALLSLKELNIDRSHNYTLDLLLFSGLPGLLAWVFLVALLLRRSRGILLVSLLTYLVWIQFQNQSIVHLIYFWLLVGLTDKS